MKKVIIAGRVALMFAVLAALLPVAHLGLISHEGSGVLLEAQGQTPPISPPNNTNTAPVIAQNKEELIGRLCDIIDVMFAGLILVAIFFALLAAYYYATSSDPEQSKTANRMLIYVVVAVVVGLFAKSVPLVVASILGETLSKCS